VDEVTTIFFKKGYQFDPLHLILGWEVGFGVWGMRFGVWIMGYGVCDTLQSILSYMRNNGVPDTRCEATSIANY